MGYGRMLRAVLAVLMVLGYAGGAVRAERLEATDYGAVADGTTDATAAIQEALDAAAKVSGSTVFLRAGRYLVEGTIRVPGATALEGEYRGQGRQKGTILLVTGGKGRADGDGCIVLTGSSQVRGLAFMYPGQTAEAEEPVEYPYTITAAGDSRIEDIYLHNSYQGINLDGAHANLVRNVWGEPLKVGINSDHTYDISRIENVHFWPYFTLGKPLREWVQNNGVAFQFGRSDWQSCLNTFCFGYHTGYRFYKSEEVKDKGYPGGGTNGSFVGIGADKVVIGVDVEESFSIGVSITNGMFAPFGSTDGVGVYLRKTNTGNLTLSNCNFWAVTGSVARVEAGSLNMNSCNIQEWAVTNKDAACFLQTGGRLNVNNCTFNGGGLLGGLSGESARCSLIGNMGDEPLRIESGIGERLVTGLNSPALEVTVPE